MRHIEDPTVEAAREVTHHDGPITGSLRRGDGEILNGGVENLISSNSSGISTAMVDDMALNEMVEELIDGTHESLRSTVEYDWGSDRFEPTY